MRVLIVAKTRRGTGACVGGITQDGRSVRLVAADADRNEHAGLEYNVGEAWEIESTPDLAIIPPHVENIIVHSARRLKRVPNTEEIIRRFMPPVAGGPDQLFEGRLQALPSGALYIAERTGLPLRSTMFWSPDQPLERDTDGKRIRYRYPTNDGGRTLTFVGFQEPAQVIPAGSLLRVSLAHWWKPKDAPPEEALRCHAQLSGWFLPEQADLPLGRSAELHSAVSPICNRQGARSAEAPLTDAPAAECNSAIQQIENLRYDSAGSGEADRDRSPGAAPAADLTRARQILKHTFGFAEFYPLQAEVVRRVLEGKDTLVIMPTGGGKSLCYQLPALLLDGLTVVVSPLIALMQDQVSQLHQLAIRAAFLNSTLALREYTSITTRVRGGDVRILYVAPETLLRPETLVLLEQSRLACIAVDEAHCISEWGHDFRPEYRQIQEVRRRFPQAVCVALTATATARVREDIRRLLRIGPDGEFVASFNRPNLFLAVKPRRDGLGQVLAFLEQHKGQSGIIYSSTKKQVDRLAAELTARGWPALPYHAGLDAGTRRRNQDEFIRDDATVMVATIAFGLGINKSNVRFVLHFNLPRDIESYYQEIGRSGRDGLPADCLLLHSRADAITIRKFIDEGAAAEAAGRQARLEAMIRYAETAGCRRVPLLGYFGERLAAGGQPEGSTDDPQAMGSTGDPPDGTGETVRSIRGALSASDDSSVPVGGSPTGAGGSPAPPGSQPHCGHCDNCRAGQQPVELTDVTVAAQKFLSCVKRTGEMFGTAHIIDVLRGSESQRVQARGHARLSTYGIGLEFSKEEWRDLARQFIEQGLLEQDFQHGGLRLTAKARPVLKDAKVFARLAPEPVALLNEAETAPKEHDFALFEELRKLRRGLADQAGVPPYIIFSDRALVEMATHFPRTPAEFLEINGVGEAKLAHYGETFLKSIRDFCNAHGIPEAPPVAAPPPASAASEPTRWLTARHRHDEIGEAFATGATLDELASRFDIKRETAIQNLARYVESGGKLDAGRLLAGSQLAADQREEVFAAFARHGLERLSPVHDALRWAVSYEELHLLRLCLRCRE